MRILVTGAATWTGGTLIRHLERRGDMKVFAVDDIAPRVELESEFRQIGLDRLELAHYLLEVAPDSVVHLQTVDRSRELGLVRAHEQTVLGAQALFGAIGRSPATRQVIIKSDAAVYGSGPRLPSVLSETTKPRGPSTPYQRDLSEMEQFVAEMAAAHPDAVHTVLRFAPIIGARIGNPISRYLSLPTVPTMLGFDPRMQFIHEDDAVAALLHIIDRPQPGTFNVAARGQLYLSRVLRLGRRLPQPLPRIAFDRALRGLTRLGLAIPDHLAGLLKHGRVLNLEAAQERLGFSPRLTCRQTVLAAYDRLPVASGNDAPSP